MRRLAIEEGERILTAYAEPSSGPGWSNRPVWIIVAGRDNKLRQECLQPDEQTVEMLSLYGIAAEVQRAMSSAARMSVRVRKPAKTAA